jgi:hypothetical protein
LFSTLLAGRGCSDPRLDQLQDLRTKAHGTSFAIEGLEDETGRCGKIALFGRGPCPCLDFSRLVQELLTWLSLG